MPVKEFTDFSGGLVNVKAATEIAPNELQKSRACDSSQGGVLRCKLGWAKVNSSAMDADIDDIFFQSIFTDESFIVRANVILYDLDVAAGTPIPIRYDVPDAEHRFEIFGAWVIIVDGTGNWKYRQDGTTIMWHTGYCYPWEGLNHLDTSTMYACILSFIWCSTGYWACYEWEQEQVDGETVQAQGFDRVTSTAYLDFSTDDSSIQSYARPVQLGITAPGTLTAAEPDWDVGYLHLWEEPYALSLATAALIERLPSTSSNNYECFFNWEVEQVQGDTITGTAGDLATNLPTVAGMVDGTVNYKVSYLNVATFESNMGAATEIILEDGRVELTGIPISADPQVVARNIYRTEDAGATYKLVVQLADNHTTAYLDNIADTALGATVDTQDHDVPPAAIDVTEHLSLLFLLKSPNEVWWCNAFDEWEYFEVTNYEPFGSAARTGRKVQTLGDHLAAVLDTEIWKWTGSSETDFAKEKSLSNRGAVASKAVFPRGDVILFVDGAGLFMYGTDSPLVMAGVPTKDIYISEKVEALFRPEWVNADRLELAQKSKCVAAYLDGELLIAYPASGSAANNRLLRADMLRQSFDLMEVAFTNLVVDQAGKKFYSTAGAFIYEMWTGQYRGDGTTLINLEVQTKDFGKEFGALAARKEVEWIKFDCDPNDGQVIVTIYIDGTASGSWTVNSGNRSWNRKRAKVDKSGYRIMVKIEATHNAEFYGLALKVEAKEDL